jgi:hypothetical protein
MNTLVDVTLRIGACVLEETMELLGIACIFTICFEGIMRKKHGCYDVLIETEYWVSYALSTKVDGVLAFLYE